VEGIKMPEISNKFVVVTITKDEAKVWATGLEKKSKPEKISAIDNNRHHHKLRQEQRHKGPGLDPESKAFFEKLSEVLKPAAESLLLGHGEGKADAVHNFQSYLKEKHHELAKKVVGVIEADVAHMTEPQVLAEARAWFDKHHKIGL
jgi:hypothetical protein